MPGVVVIDFIKQNLKKPRTSLSWSPITWLRYHSVCGLRYFVHFLQASAENGIREANTMIGRYGKYASYTGKKLGSVECWYND